MKLCTRIRSTLTFILRIPIGIAFVILMGLFTLFSLCILATMKETKGSIYSNAEVYKLIWDWWTRDFLITTWEITTGKQKLLKLIRDIMTLNSTPS